MPPDLKDDLASLRLPAEPAASPRRSPLPLALGILLVAAAGAWAVWGRSEAATVKTAVAVAASGGPGSTASTVLTASGYVVARRKAVVSAKIQGRLATLAVEEGSRVRAGEVLATLESADHEARVGASRAGVERAEAELSESRRQEALAERLVNERLLRGDDLDSARGRRRVSEAALSQARAEVAVSEAALRDTRILAPFTGTVVKKMAEVGESVAPIPPGVNLSTSSGAIVALADLETLEVEADVNEAQVARLAPAQPARVTVEAFPDRTLAAVLRQVIPTADRTKATVQVKVTILDKDDRLRPEMSARVDFVEDRKATPEAPARPVITVPSGALATVEGASVVFEVVDLVHHRGLLEGTAEVAEGVARARTVTVGSSRGGTAEVKSGLAGGETVVIDPPATLKDGDRVRVAS